MKKLHLGCGKTYLPGWANVDIFSNTKADAYHDVTSLPYERESFDIIYASHILEHVHRHMVLATLNHWVGLLKRGGILRLAVPDFAAAVHHYQKTHSIEDIMGLLYGGQNCHLNRHTIAFDDGSLTGYMRQSGLINVHKWDWRYTDHAAHDDYSQAYLPHMAKNDDGILMSLNLEGVKP